MERVSILIDSGNFYHVVLKKLGLIEGEFDFDAFAKFLANGREIPAGGKRFYVGTVREMGDGHENETAISNQTRLFTELKKAGWDIKTSKLRTRVERIQIDDRVTNAADLRKLGISEIEYRRSREKGIDVKIAVDLLVGAFDHKYDTAIVVSSDSDLVPAIDWVRMRGKKKVEYIGFSTPDRGSHEGVKPTKSLIFRTDVQRVLVESDIRHFVKPSLFGAPHF